MQGLQARLWGEHEDAGDKVMSKPNEGHLHRKQKNDRHGTKVTLARARARLLALSHARHVSLSQSLSLAGVLLFAPPHQVRMRQPLLFDAELKDARCGCPCCALARQSGAVAQLS